MIFAALRRPHVMPMSLQHNPLPAWCRSDIECVNLLLTRSLSIWCLMLVC